MEAYTSDGSNKAHGHCTFGLQFPAQHISDGSWADADDMEGDLDSTFFAMQGLISSCGDLVPSSEVSEQLDSLNEYIVENYQAQINDAKDRYKNSLIKKLKIAGGAIATVGTGLYSAWEFLGDGFF